MGSCEYLDQWLAEMKHAMLMHAVNGSEERSNLSLCGREIT